MKAVEQMFEANRIWPIEDTVRVTKMQNVQIIENPIELKVRTTPQQLAVLRRAIALWERSGTETASEEARHDQAME